MTGTGTHRSGEQRGAERGDEGAEPTIGRSPRSGAGPDALEPDPRDEELAVRTIELDTDDGGTVVLGQQNMGGRRQSGGGEYKNADHGPTVEEAAIAQHEVDESTGEPVGSGPHVEAAEDEPEREGP